MGRKSELLTVELVPLEFTFHNARGGDLCFKCFGVDPAVAPDPLQAEIREWHRYKIECHITHC